MATCADLYFILFKSIASSEVEEAILNEQISDWINFSLNEISLSNKYDQFILTCSCALIVIKENNFIEIEKKLNLILSLTKSNFELIQNAANDICKSLNDDCDIQETNYNDLKYDDISRHSTNDSNFNVELEEKSLIADFFDKLPLDKDILVIEEKQLKLLGRKKKAPEPIKARRKQNQYNVSELLK